MHHRGWAPALAAECGLATNYRTVDHPSLPNYAGAVTGLPYASLKPIKSDCNPSKRCSTFAPSIFGEVGWKACEESNAGEYAVRHNPPPYLSSLTTCSSLDVPYPQLATDRRPGTLPAFSFVTPNLIDDMQEGTSTAVVVTLDEGEGGKVNDSATNTNTNTTDIGCHVVTIVVSPSTVPGTQSATLFNHYSLLGTTEQILGVPLLGQAATANCMLGDFNL